MINLLNADNRDNDLNQISADLPRNTQMMFYRVKNSVAPSTNFMSRNATTAGLHTTNACSPMKTSKMNKYGSEMELGDDP